MQNNKIEYSYLLDAYGELLTGHQKDILNEYLNEDLSMTEIAENYKISKSAVQDLIKRSIDQLINYEKSLNLVKKEKELNKIIDGMNKQKNKVLDKYIKKLEKIK